MELSCDLCAGAETAAKALTLSAAVVDQANIGGQVRAIDRQQPVYAHSGLRSQIDHLVVTVLIPFAGALQKLPLLLVDAGACNRSTGMRVEIAMVNFKHALPTNLTYQSASPDARALCYVANCYKKDYLQVEPPATRYPGAISAT